MTTSISARSTVLSDARCSAGPLSAARRSEVVTAGRLTCRPNAVATSRAIPLTDMQSGRLPVTSKSMTVSPSPSRSSPSTAKPRTDIVAAISSAAAGASTHTRSQERRTFMDREPCRSQRRELLEEAHVLLVEQSAVLDAVLQHGDALDPHAECEAGHALGVIAHRLEDRWMHHATPENLDPAGLLADRAAGAATLVATDVDLGAGLGIWKEAGSQPDLHVAEERGDHRLERSLEIRHRDVLADDQRLELLEHRRVRQIEVVAAIDSPGHEQANRRFERLHVADLHRRRVRPQQRRRAHLRLRDASSMCAPRAADDRALEIEGVLHVARGMIRRHVQRLEVVEVVFDFGPLEDLVALVREDVFDLLPYQHQRVDVADRAHARGERDVPRARGRACCGERLGGALVPPAHFL